MAHRARSYLLISSADPFPLEAPITIVLVVVTVLVSMVCFQDRRLLDTLAFQPYGVRHQGQWYRLFTHAFVHVDWGHLFVNMFVLFMFGRDVEFHFAAISQIPSFVIYATLYIGGTLFATLPGIARHGQEPNYRSVGASGAVSAVLFSLILMFPTREMSGPFIQHVPNWLFGVLYLFGSYYMDKRGGDHVAHDAHFYGAVFGVLFTTALDPDLLLHFGAFQRSIGY